ncbi:MAG: hypothetical protein HZA61_05480 [Candidatus Eisenbacteria bacterium]|uniref:2-isopropylmalate synthase LeuA allosteric (dimerisation) domain-containing protein n=1 Tax=Eiseniibacteriota bacterium TaxID=2212470 RepID=A0A933SC03_UNCEI|nr:hypothetical protein [Candidatus Eisenbacteria bacterium]
MNVTSTTLASKAEAAIRRLREIEGVSVHADGDAIREVHVLTSSERPAKNIVRDVQTVLKTRLGVTIDHRVVSVAQASPGSGAEFAAEPELAASGARAAAPAPASAPAPEPEVVREERIRFESVNLFVSGPRTQAQVELRWKGLPRIGSASGWSARDESHRLVAQATATAAQEFLADPMAIGVQGVEFVEIGRHRTVIVMLSLLANRQEKVVTGSCLVEQDTPQAVVLATLAALNRVLGGLRVKEPTEYVLRPTTN